MGSEHVRRLARQLRAGATLVLKRCGQAIGLELARSSLKSRADLRLAHYLKLNGVDVVIDVGANRGQFAKQLFAAGYDGRIVSFEPLPDAHNALTKRASEFGRRWTVAPRVALSDRAGTAEFHVTETDTASSLLRPDNGLVAATPQTRPTRRIEVATARLDDYLRETDLLRRGLFVKLDVQGAESLVLAGATQALTVATGILVELSLTPLYEGQPLAQDVLGVLSAAEFDVWDIWDGYRNPRTYRLNQVDVVCFRRGDVTSGGGFGGAA